MAAFRGVGLMAAVALVTGCASTAPAINAQSPALSPAAKAQTATSQTISTPSVPYWLFQERPGYATGCVSYAPDVVYQRQVRAAKIKALAALAEQHNGARIDGAEDLTTTESAGVVDEQYQRTITQNVSGFVSAASIIRQEIVSFPTGDRLCVAVTAASVTN